MLSAVFVGCGEELLFEQAESCVPLFDFKEQKNARSIAPISTLAVLMLLGRRI